MNEDNQNITNKYQVTYSFSHREWSNQIGLQCWPAYVCFVIAILLGLLTKYSDLALYLGILSVLVLLFCLFVTRFYANSILAITENGLIVTKKGRTIHFNWSDISNIAFIIPSHGASYLETVIAIFNENNEVDYIIIESLYFKMANTKAGEIGLLVEKLLKGYSFKIQRSNFYAPVFSRRKDLIPTIYT